MPRMGREVTGLVERGHRSRAGATQLPMAARVLSGQRRLADGVPRLMDGWRGRHQGRRSRGEENRRARGRRPRGRGRARGGAELPSACARVLSTRTAGAGGAQTLAHVAAAVRGSGRGGRKPVRWRHRGEFWQPDGVGEEASAQDLANIWLPRVAILLYWGRLVGAAGE
jgi:hypothetical protein